MIHFIWGAFMMACCVAAMFFLRFWRLTGDRFFLLFSAAFWVFGIERIVLAQRHVNGEADTYVYILRLVANMFIVWAIIDKNRTAKPPSNVT